VQDNHIWAAGGIANAVKAAKRVGGFSTKIEVECRSLADAEEAVSLTVLVSGVNADCACGEPSLENQLPLSLTRAFPAGRCRRRYHHV